MMVFGLGTGRCGTLSLAKLLNLQPNTLVFHELDPVAMAWEGAEDVVIRTAQAFRAVLDGERPELPPRLAARNSEAADKLARERCFRMAGDVAFYYLPYVPFLLSRFPDTRFVCLRRDEAATVRSYMRKTVRKRPRPQRILLGKYRHRNHWVCHRGYRWARDEVWDKCYPKYRARTKRGALHLYWRDYYRRARELGLRYPERFRIWQVDALNSRVGQEEILDFVGIPPERQRTTGDLHMNACSKRP